LNSLTAKVSNNPLICDCCADFPGQYHKNDRLRLVGRADEVSVLENGQLWCQDDAVQSGVGSAMLKMI